MVLFLLVFILAASTLADSFAPDYYQYSVRYSSGTGLVGWTTECNTDENDDSDDWSGSFSCSVSGLGTPSNPQWCDEESTVQVRWRMSHDPDAGQPNVQTYTSWEDMYTINWDGDSDDCECYVGPNLYAIGGDVGSCCGDDANEFELDEVGATDSNNSNACCNLANKCVDDNACYDDADCHDTGSADSINEYCDAGTWVDNDNSSVFCDTCADAGQYDVGFEAGTIPLCCEDDPGEFFNDENGCVDCTDGSDPECCDNGNDCVDDNVCYDDGTCRDTGGTASDEEYCDSDSWHDNDEDQVYCDACVGVGNWGMGFELLVTEGDCCGDDAPNEYRIEEFDSPLNDGVNSTMCCDNMFDCVDENDCYDDEYNRHNIREADERGLPVTDDREICDGDADHGIGDNNDWHDADEDLSFCNLAMVPEPDLAVLIDCSPYPDCWIPEGESGFAFGGYIDDDHDEGCCGDDTGENYIMTDYYNDACCNDSTDFVAFNGTCQDQANRAYLYGRVMGQIPNGSYISLYHALVQVVDPDTGMLVNQNYTNRSGYYNISVILGQNYDLVLRPNASYRGNTTRLSNVVAHTRTDFNISLLSSCLYDCTSFNLNDNRYYCDEDCDGVSNCVFNSSVISVSSDYDAFPDKSMKALCHGLTPSWSVKHNDTYDIVCCNQGYVTTPSKQSASVDLTSGYRQVDSYYGGLVSYYGKFVSVWIAMGDE